MRNENRKDERFENKGRVDVMDLCPLPGVLDDISLTGCKVHFPATVSVDMDKDYDVSLKISHRGVIPALNLICHPQWVKTLENKSFVGFRFLRSPNTPQLTSFIKKLKDEANPNDVFNMLIESSVCFI